MKSKVNEELHLFGTFFDMVKIDRTTGIAQSV
jgi:hypothetical protein